MKKGCIDNGSVMAVRHNARKEAGDKPHLINPSLVVILLFCILHFPFAIGWPAGLSIRLSASVSIADYSEIILLASDESFALCS